MAEAQSMRVLRSKMFQELKDSELETSGLVSIGSTECAIILAQGIYFKLFCSRVSHWIKQTWRATTTATTAAAEESHHGGLTRRDGHEMAKDHVGQHRE